MWCIQGPVYSFVSIIINDRFIARLLVIICNAMILQKGTDQYGFGVSGEETGKEHLSDNCC